MCFQESSNDTRKLECWPLLLLCVNFLTHQSFLDLFVPGQSSNRYDNSESNDFFVGWVAQKRAFLAHCALRIAGLPTKAQVRAVL